jgi:hypothetical protein
MSKDSTIFVNRSASTGSEHYLSRVWLSCEERQGIYTVLTHGRGRRSGALVLRQTKN